MTFTMTALAKSLAEYLAPSLPDVMFCGGPNQQGTTPPVMFLQVISAKLESHIGDRVLRKLELDLVYLENFNLTDTESRVLSAAETLDELLETFPYRNDGETVLLRTFGRKWNVTADILHYKFGLRLRLARQDDAALMESIQELRMEEKR